MRIAHVVHWFLPRHRSGTEQHVYALAREQISRHQVAVFCGQDDPTQPLAVDEAWDGLVIRRVRVAPGAEAPLWRRARGRFQSRVAEQAFEQFLQAFRPEVVHVHHLFKLSGGLIGVARQYRIPVVVTLHDYWFVCDNAQLLYRGQVPCSGPRGGWRCAACMSYELGNARFGRLAPLAAPFYVYRNRYLRRALQQADAVIAPSVCVRQRLQDAGVFLSHARVLHHGIDDSWLEGYRRIARQGPLRLGYLGTIAPHKGVDLLLKAFLRLPKGEAELHIFGAVGVRAEYLHSLQQLAAGSSVFFHGPYQRPDLGKILARLDVVIVPSIWAENAPLVVQEALLARVPVLASATGGLPEFVAHEETGLLFPPGDVAALEAALRRLLSDPLLLERWARAIHPPKTMGQYAAEMEALYEQILA